MSDVPSIRVRRGRQNANYTAISNKLIDHPTLSPSARLVLIYLLSKPPDWQLQVSDLCRLLGTADKTCGRNKTYEVIRELKKSAYVVAVEEKDNGRFVGVTYYVYDEPFDAGVGEANSPSVGDKKAANFEPKTPCTENRDTERIPCTEKRDTGNRHLTNKRKKQNTDLPPSPPERGRNGSSRPKEEAFEKFWDDWPRDQRPDIRQAALSAFNRLNAADQASAIRHAQSFRLLCQKREEPALMIRYLKNLLFQEIAEGPEVTPEGYFYFTPERPEWEAWLDRLESRFGADARARILKAGFFKDDVDLEAKLEVWEQFYNLHRPHGAFNGKTPYEALSEKLK